MGSPMSTPNTGDTEMTTDTEENENNDDKMTKRHIDIEDSVDYQGALINQLPAYDRLLNAEIMVQAEEGHVSGKVTKRVLGPDGKVAGKYDDNPYLNSIIYKVELADGRIKEYGANIIAENMLTQVDSDGFSLSLMEGIIDYKRDDSVAISKTDKYITTSRGQRRLCKTTAGWKLLVKWRDQSESWVKLSELKESILQYEIGRYFELKEASIGPPKMYLGAGIRKVKLDNGMEAWAASSSQYVQAAVKNVEEYIEKSHHKQWRIPNKVETNISP